jgi:hypothetical protein
MGFAKPENPRKKVELGAGKSLVQWINLSNTQNLASQRLDYVDEIELMKHDRVNDCWILLYDMVSCLVCHTKLFIGIRRNEIFRLSSRRRCRTISCSWNRRNGAFYKRTSMG